MGNFANQFGLRPGEVDCFSADKFELLAGSAERAAAVIHLNMAGCSGLTDSHLQSLARFPALESLTLRGTRIGDASMPYVAALSSLQSLDITGTRVTDEGLKNLFGHPSLQVLRMTPVSLDCACITRAGACALLETMGSRLTILLS